jgi:transmembrane sensor
MNNVYEMPNGNSSYDEASAWIAKLDKGLSEQEQAELRRWLDASAGNQAVFMKMARLWDKMDALSSLAEICPPVETAPRRRMRFALPVAILAATALVAITLATWMSTGIEQERAVAETMATVADDIFETAVGEQASYELADGTRISLNTNSRVTVSYSASNRLLYLDRGELHVTVTRDKLRPLSVLVGERVVQAVGTEFNIEITGEQRVELVVTEGVVMVGIDAGSVAAGNSQGPLVLTQTATPVAAGQEVVIDSNDDPDEPVAAEDIDADDIAVKLSWREGNLIFRGESLEEAVSEVGRYTEVQFIFLDEESKKVRVAGLFKAGDVEGLLAALRQNFNISYEWVADDKIALSGD